MAGYLPTQLSLARIRSYPRYLSRLPLATRIVLLIVVACYVASILAPGVHEAAVLKPSLIGLQSYMPSLHRLSVYPFFHRGFFHVAFNLLALVPLLERFEAENGSLVTIILFSGPFATFPGAVYVIFERFLFQSDTAVEGASIWVFLLISVEAMKMYRANPYFSLGTHKIPTWTWPVVFIFLVSFLMPNTSLIGHLCGALIGYGWGCGLLRILSPPEWVVRWIEGKLNLLGRVPHYVSVDQKTYGRYGVLPSTFNGAERADNHAMNFFGPGQRVGTAP